MFEDSSSTNGVFRSEAPLTRQYTPEKIVGRDQEIAYIADAVRPLTERRTPVPLLVYGPSGPGKTACVNHVFQQLEEESRVIPVYINCWQYNTRPALLTELLISLGYPVPRKGRTLDVLLSKLRELLDKSKGIAVALDEFDQLDAKTEVIYDLQMVDLKAEPGLGIVMVSNQPPTRLEMDPRSQSRLGWQTLEFHPYTADQLTAVLQDRIEQAFEPGTVADDVVQYIASEIAAGDGDCRRALELLRRAGRRADQGDSHAVTKTHVETVLTQEE